MVRHNAKNVQLNDVFEADALNGLTLMQPFGVGQDGGFDRGGALLLLLCVDVAAFVVV